jgi:hypothetical protein
VQEPPQQAPAAGGAAAGGAPEAAHMLDDRLFAAAAAALQPGGTLTLVVRCFARPDAPPPPLRRSPSISADAPCPPLPRRARDVPAPPDCRPRAATPQTDNAWYADLLLDRLAQNTAFRPVPTAGRLPPGAKLVRAAAGIELISATPGSWCRHAAAGASSYFDRLWKTGLSAHSATHERFVLHVAVPSAPKKSKGKRARGGSAVV